MNENKVPVDLSGQVAVVTGASRGIGRAISTHLGNCGARVALWSRDENELGHAYAELQSIGVTSLPVRVDVTNAEQVRDAMATTERQLGSTTLLVNNAGRGRCIGPLWETDPDDWWADVEVNLRGTMLCAHAVLSRMVPRGFGRIVNISSGAGNMTLPMASSYACSKAAVQRLTDCLAAAARSHGICVFAVSPGPTRTAMTQLTFPPKPDPAEMLVFGGIKEDPGHEQEESSHDGADREQAPPGGRGAGQGPVDRDRL